MSYRRTRESATAGGSASVTVCTNDLALCHLVENALPLAVSKAGGDAEFLVAEMVELQDNRVSLAAVCAGMLA